MKRLFEKYNDFFNKNGVQLHNIGVDVSYLEIPEDADVSGYEIIPTNIYYESSYVQIVDENGNRLIIKYPKWLEQILFETYYAGLKNCSNLIQKNITETVMVKNNIKIPYNNTTL